MEYFKKILTMTTDNCANMICTVHMFENVTSIPCLAHNLNLCVSDLFSNAKQKKAYAKLKKANSNYEDTTLLYLIDIKESVNELILKCKKLIGSFRHSEALVKKLKEYQIKLDLEEKIKLVQDVPTRWNTTLDMIYSLIVNRDSINCLRLNHKNLKFPCESYPNEKEFELLNDLYVLLQPIKDITELLSGSQYSTSSVSFPAMYDLITDELPKINITNHDVIVLRKELIKSLKERFKYIFNNDLILACSLLDSRFKNFNYINSNSEKFEYLNRSKKFLINFSRINFEEEPNNNVASQMNLNETSQSQPCVSSAKSFISRKDRKSFIQKLTGITHDEMSEKNYRIENEIQSFLSETSKFDDPLEFFKIYEKKYHLLSKISKYLLSIPISSVPCESLFSQVGLIATALRNRLHSSTLENISFIKQNI